MYLADQPDHLSYCLVSGGFRGGAQGARAPLLVEYLQKIYKKTTEMSIQKPF